MYLPSKNKLLTLIVFAMILPDARSELVYHCTTQKNKVHSYSMDEVKELLLLIRLLHDFFYDRSAI